MHSLLCRLDDFGVVTVTIKALIWDWGNVLVSWRPADLFNQLISNPAQATWWSAHAFSPAWNALGDKGMPYAEANKIWEQDFTTLHADKISIYPKYRALIAAYGNHPEETHAFRNEQTLALRDGLATSYPTFALTNVLQDNWERVNRAHGGVFDRNFREIIMSSQQGIAKPDDGIFQKTISMLNRHGLDAREALFIDDSIKNVEASQRNGLPAVQFHNAAQLVRDLTQHGVQAQQILLPTVEWVRANGTGQIKPIM